MVKELKEYTYTVPSGLKITQLLNSEDAKRLGLTGGKARGTTYQQPVNTPDADKQTSVTGKARAVKNKAAQPVVETFRVEPLGDESW